MVDVQKTREKWWAVLPTILVDGVLAVIGAQVSNIYVSVVILVLVCLAQLIAIWKLETFKRQWATLLFGASVVIALAALWYFTRPAYQPQPATREDVHEEMNEAVKRFIPTPQSTPAPTHEPSPSPSPAKSPNKRSREAERLRRENQAVREKLNLKDP